MICQKDFSLTVNSAAPTAQAWWTMDLGIATNETDSVSGLALIAIFGGGFESSVAGKIGNALQEAAVFGTSVGSRCINAALQSNGFGFTLAGWMNVANFLPDISSATTFSYQFNQGASTYFFNLTLNVLASTWGVEWGVGPAPTAISLGYAAGWHFFAATMDLTTGVIRLAIDQGVPSTDTVAVPAPGAHTTGTIIMTCGAGGFTPGSTNTSIFDEMCLFNYVLSTAELDYLYNSGSGRTYPP